MDIFNKPLIWAIIIFVCAAIFRLTFLDLIEFKLDEARDVYEMEKFYQNPYFIQRGTIQSTGVYNPPLWYYILAVLSLPSRNPLYLSFMIGLLNCVAVAGFYLVVRKFYGQAKGIMAGLLVAFSPWAILFSRKVWAPDLIMVLLVPLFYFIHKKNAFWVVLLLSLLAQLHASGIFLAVITIIIFITVITLKKLKLNLKYAALGLIISLIPLLPYIAYQFQTGCEDCQNFFNYRDEAKAFDGNVFLRPFQLISGSSFQIVLGDDYENFSQDFPFIKIFNILFLAEFILAILGIIYIVKKEKKLWWMLMFLGVVPVLYLITQTPARLHYSIILLPIMILIYIFGLRWFKRAWVSITIITFIIIINIIFELTFYQFLDQRQKIQGDFGPIYRVTKKAVEEQTAQFKSREDYELVKAEYYMNLILDNK